MEQNAKMKKFDFREQRNSEKKMAKNVNTRSSSFGEVASSSKDSELVSTSPILDTGKIRRKGKLWTARRAVSDSAFSPGLAKLIKGQEIRHFSSTTEKTTKLDKFPPDKELKQCKCCDFPLNADNQCESCSSDKTINQKSDSLDKNLANRLKDPKHNKKPITKISDSKDAQITDEKFVQSVGILNKVQDSKSPKKVPKNPTNPSELQPFFELERLRLSQPQEQKNSSSGLAKLTEGQEIQVFCTTTEKTKKLDNFSELKQCKCCNFPLNADNQCESCFSDKTINQKSDSLDKNLVNRLRDLKRLKKSTARISDLKDARITDEEFVQSVRILDQTCDLNMRKKVAQTPANRLGLVPFIEVERSRLSQQEKQRNSPSVIHLSLDEDKEEDGDMFADKDVAEAPEYLEEFTPWKYNSPETSPLSFHGFSSEEYKSSKEIAEASTQALKSQENDSFFNGFSTADKEKSEVILEKWKAESLKRERKNLNDSGNDKEDFLSTLNSKVRRISADTGEDTIPAIDSTENVFFNYKLKRKREPENLPKTEDRCKKRITNIAELGREKLSADCEKREEVCGINTKAQVLPLPRIKYLQEKSKNDDKAGFSNSQSTFGFSTAAGRPIKLSEMAIAKAKSILSKEIESIDDDLMDNFEFDNVVDSQSKCGILNADGLSIRGSETNEERSEEKSKGKDEIKAEIEIKAEVKTEAYLEIESIEDDLFGELDNVIDSGNKFELIKGEENDLKRKDQILDHKSDLAPVSRISCGFSTAAGIPIRVSKTALEKAENCLAKELESIKDEPFDEMDEIDIIDSKSECGSTKAEGKNEGQNYKLLDKKLDNIATDSPTFSGFSTAGGILIRVSKTAFEKAETLLSTGIENLEDEFFDELDNAKDSESKCVTETQICRSETSSKEILERSPKKITKSLEKESKINFGFSTAGGRELKVSEKSWAKSKTVFDTIEDLSNAELEKKISNPEFSIEKDSKINSGFSTAGGRELKVSEKSWTKSKAIFDTIEDLSNAELEKKNSNPEFFMEKDSKINSGFSTAGGRELKVSEKSWTKSKAVFETIEDLSNAELEKKNSNPEFSIDKDGKINSGFSTAGGRELKVSEKSWTKSKAIFETIEEQSNAELAKPTLNSEFSMEKDSKINSGFSTAGGRELKVSEKSWTKSKAIFETIEDLSNPELEKKNSNPESSMEKDSKINSGFSTAGGRELKISEKSWTKSKAVFETIEDLSNAELEQKNSNPEFSIEKDSKINSGFSTAGGCELKVSEKSWTKSKAVFETIEDPCNAELEKPTLNSEFPMDKDSKINSGFSTAGGRELKVSEKSWAKSKAVFDTIEELSNAELKKENSNPEFSMKKDSKINSGFSTAGGRELKISEKSWTKSKAIFETIEEQSNAELEKPTLNPEFSIKKDSKINSGFSTAGGCELKVSEKSWTKSKAVFETIEDPCNAELEKPTLNSEFPMDKDSKINSGFSTAGGRELKVSEKSWAKSKAVFDTIEELSNAELKKENSNPEFSMKKDSKINSGFSTAGGRELKISEDSWTKSKTLFDSIDESIISEPSKTETPDPKTKTIISGFSTANGNSIKVTKEAVSAAKVQLSSDLDNLESLDFDDFMDPLEEPETTKKRKLEEIDEETPLRRESFLKRKKGRYVNDLQARKLFMEDSSGENEVEITSKSSEKNFISEEVDASAAALLEDEERSNEGNTWQINALSSAGSISPELGSEMANRSRVDVSAINSFGIFVGAEMEKVNATGEKGNSGCCRGASSGSRSEAEENNDRAASAEKREEIQHESIPDDLTFDSQFSQDIQRSPVIDKFIADAMKIIEGRLAAALKQDEAIRGKRRMKIQQNDGFLYRLRNDNKESRTSWNDLTDGIAPSHREMAKDSSGKDVLSVTADSAVNYSFRCADFYGEMDVRSNIEGIKVGDGAFLILDEKNCAGAREFERAFLASSGVDPNLVPTGWVKNHYRWIVWKLASMDRVKFGHKCLPRMLTPDRVMLELKYRYDREIYRIQWPPLRRILERGENASARLVLCVSSIVEEKDVNPPVKGAHTPNSMGSTTYKMKLTDGWYSISTSIDAAMIHLIKSGKVREGTKLMIFGAKALNLDQGCSVLEIPETVTLKICSNSTRRAKWNTKLDFYRSNRGPMSLKLKSLKPNGETICKLVVAVSRVYPILYCEKLPNGKFEFRNARRDEEAARAHEARYQAKMEEIYANAWSEFQIASMKRKGIDGAKIRSYTQEEAAACGRDMEEELRQKISSKMSECLPTPRNVTPVMKIRIAEDDTCALVTVWSTDRDTTELFVEGSSIAIYNAAVAGLRSSELQITAGRSTFVKREISRRIPYPERIYTPLSDVMESGFNPVYGEFDTIGIVSSTGPAPHGMKNFETVNLACPKSGDGDASDFLSVLFWQGVSDHGYAKILTVGSLVACSNLEWRRNTSRSIPTAYCTERSIFSKNPRQNHLVQAFESLRNEIKEPQAYAAACAAVIQEEIAKKSALRTPNNCGTPYRPATSNNRTPGWSPRDLTIEPTCTTPRIDSRGISIRKRLEKLESYGEPPKLPSIVLNSSRKVSADFRSPVRNPVTKS